MWADGGDAFYAKFEALRARLMEADASRFREVSSRLPASTGDRTEVDELVLREEELRCFEGDVYVRGDVRLDEEGALLVVAGDLHIEGTLHAHAWYSLAFCGGRLHASSIRTKGEIVALGGVEVKRFYWGYYNDYSTIAPTFDGPLYVADDRFDSIDQVRAHETLTSIVAARDALTRLGGSEEDIADLIRIASS